MSYELFKKAAFTNAELDVVPANVQILSIGAMTDTRGNINYKGKTYVTNMVKLNEMPEKLQNLFFEECEMTKEEVEVIEEDESQGQLGKLNDILFQELESITNSENEKDIDKHIKKANAVCNVADKLISIADLSLKAEMSFSKGLIENKSKMIKYR